MHVVASTTSFSVKRSACLFRAIRKGVPILLMALMVSLSPRNADASLVVNGGFETPPQPSNYLLINPGSEPSGFGWSVTSGNVEIHSQGYVGGSGTFSGPAYEGDQWLDLDGYPGPGAIAQTLTTNAGTQYRLDFAYANNPFHANPDSMTVYVKNSSNNANLIAPLLFSHGTATASNYDWRLSGPIFFVALGGNTSLQFVSNNGSGDGGIFLDDISVEAVQAVPEPSTSILICLSAVSTIFVRRRMPMPMSN